VCEEIGRPHCGPILCTGATCAAGWEPAIRACQLRSRFGGDVIMIESSLITGAVCLWLMLWLTPRREGSDEIMRHRRQDMDASDAVSSIAALDGPSRVLSGERHREQPRGRVLYWPRGCYCPKHFVVAGAVEAVRQDVMRKRRINSCGPRHTVVSRQAIGADNPPCPEVTRCGWRRSPAVEWSTRWGIARE